MIVTCDSKAIDEIGREAGLLLWNDLDYYEQTHISNNDREGDYYVGSILPATEKRPPLLVFQPARFYLGLQSEYTINLQTGRPTERSMCRKIPRLDLVRKLYPYSAKQNGKTTGNIQTIESMFRRQSPR